MKMGGLLTGRSVAMVPLGSGLRSPHPPGLVYLKNIHCFGAVLGASILFHVVIVTYCIAERCFWELLSCLFVRLIGLYKRAMRSLPFNR